MSDSMPTPAPLINPDTARFWAATTRDVLLLQRCDRCDAVIWYPRMMCPECGSQELSEFESTGTGTVYSWTRVHKGQEDYKGAAPFVLAYVELDDGPRIMTNIIDADSVAVGDPVTLVFDATEIDAKLPRFRLT